MRFLSLRYWWRHFGAFWLATLGVTLGVAVFVSVQVANHSVLSAFGASLEAVAGKATLQIRGGANGLPESVYTRLMLQPDARIKAAAPIVTRTLFSPTLKLSPRDEGTSLLVMGIDIFAEAAFRDIDFSAEPGATRPQRGSPGASDQTSSFAKFLLDPNAIAISEQLARKYNLQTGSRLQLFIGAQRQDFTVTAVLRDADFNRAFGGDFALLDIAAAQESFREIGKLSQIDLVVEEANIPTVTAELQRWLPVDATVQRPAQRGAQVADMLGAFQLNLSALSCITLFVGAFLIYNTIAIDVVRRRREAATLRAFGTSGSQLTRMFMLEAAGIGLVGSLIGLALGVGLAHWTLGAVSKTVSALYIAVKARDLYVPLWLWWGAPLGGTLLATIAAYPAAREAAHTSPRAALQPVTLHHATTSFAKPFALGGLALLALSWLLCQPFLASRTVWMGFIATFCTLAGFAMLTPICTLWAGQAVQTLGAKYFGAETLLAGAYLQRAIHRSSLVIAALMVSLAMTIGLAVMVGSFRNTVAEWVDNTISADLFIAPARGFSEDAGPGLPEEVVQFARTHPDVRLLDTIRGAEIMLGKQPVFIAANSLPGLQSGERRMRFVETANGEAAAKTAYGNGQAILISERFQNLLGYNAGQSVSLLTPSGRVAFPIAGVFYDYTPNECVMYMPKALYQRYWKDTATDGLALYLKAGVPVEQVQREITNRFAQRYQLTLLPNREIRQSVFNTFDQTFAVTYALQLIAVIVAAIGIFDTLIALLLERSREHSTLRATGASGAQILKLTLIEFGCIGGLAWLIGCFAGVFLAWELIFVINRQFFGWTIHPYLPAQVLSQALALALLAAWGAGIGPAWAAARRNIAAELQTE